MKIVRYLIQGNMHYGVLARDRVYRVSEPGCDWGKWNLKCELEQYDLKDIRLLSPCQPSKIICLGLNYRSHAEELALPVPKDPVIFMKPPTAVVGPEEIVEYPSFSNRVDYEAELGVVIGKKASKVSRKKAFDYVFGYTCANDVTARDKQEPGGQWTYAKSFDTFCPIGPVIETGIKNPDNLEIRGILNGETVQKANTSEHLFPVDQIIEYISGCMTLLPGDIILTGTPSGIGPMKPGDRFEVLIKGIGLLSNFIK